MSNKFEWIENNPLVSFEGDFTFAEIYHVDGKIFGDSRFDLMRYVIYNLLEVNSLRISNEEIELISTPAWRRLAIAYLRPVINNANLSEPSVLIC